MFCEIVNPAKKARLVVPQELDQEPRDRGRPASAGPSPRRRDAAADNRPMSRTSRTRPSMAE